MNRFSLANPFVNGVYIQSQWIVFDNKTCRFLSLPSENFPAMKELVDALNSACGNEQV